jgi:glycosyltransferase involved in cell wall biosynthesis
MGEPLVSICVPTYNRAGFLRESLESIRQQDYTPLEILISDNCSDDETETMCRELERIDPRIRYVRQPSHIGLYANHNVCIGASRGEFVCFYHDDDIYDPRIVSASVRFLRQHARVGIVCSDWDVIDDKGEIIGARDHRARAVTPGVEYIGRTIRSGRSSIGLSGAMVRRSALGERRFFEGGPVGFGDITLWCCLAETCDVGHINQRLYRYRLHRRSFSRTTLVEFTRHYRETLARYCREHLERWPHHRALVDEWRSSIDRYVFWALVYEVGLHVRRRNDGAREDKQLPQTMYEIADYRLSPGEFREVTLQLEQLSRGAFQRLTVATIRLLLRLGLTWPLAWATRHVGAFRALLGVS